MPRGQTLKTKKRNLRQLTKVEEKARRDSIKKWYERNPQAWISERLADIADNTGLMDVAKFGAVLGLTLVVKRVIDTSEEIRAKLHADFGTGYFRDFPVSYLRLMLRTVGIVPPEGAFTKETLKDIEGYEGFLPDWMDWLTAFCLAYLIIEHFGDIMHASGNIISSVKSLVSGFILGGA